MPDPQTDGSGNGADGAQGGGTPPAASFAEFMAAQPPEVQALYQAETAGLTSALDKERDKAKSASAQLRELAKTADPETAKRLQAAADEKDAENKALKTQLEFTTAAVKLGCRAPEKAWAVAQATGLTAEQMKADADWAFLFTASKPPDARAGNGTSGSGSAPITMNDLIRGKAGRTG